MNKDMYPSPVVYLPMHTAGLLRDYSCVQYEPRFTLSVS